MQIEYYNWSAAENCEQLKFNDVAPAPPGVPVRNESEFNAPNFVPPLQTFYTVESDYNFTEHSRSCGKLVSVCYPTVAPSSLRLYTSNVIPGWENNLLMTTLKAGRIFKIALNENGMALAHTFVSSVIFFKITSSSTFGLTIFLYYRGIRHFICFTTALLLSRPMSISAFDYYLLSILLFQKY